MEDIDQLINYLFSDRNGTVYNAQAIPLVGRQPTTINTQVYLNEIVKFDSLHQELQVLLTVYLDWYDHRLTWDPEKFNGVHQISVSHTNIWFPNFGVCNSNTGSARFTTEDNTDTIQVNSDGTLFWSQMNRQSVKCSDVTEPTLFRFGYGYVGSVGNRLKFFDRTTEIESTELTPKLCRLWRLRRFNICFARSRIGLSFENFSDFYVNNCHKRANFGQIIDQVVTGITLKPCHN